MKCSSGIRLFTAALVVVCIATVFPAVSRAETVIRLGTLAPSGTSYHNALLEMGQKWRDASGGTVRLIVYPDGRQGGESDMVRKMRAGQLNAGMLTVMGLADIDKSVSCLQYLPMVFRSWEEVDYARAKLGPRLEQSLANQGFVALFWGDAGWVRFFTKTQAVRPDDFKKMKLFAWSGDPAYISLCTSMGYRPVPLETADMLPGMQTGLINAAAATPLFALTAQLDGVAPYMLDVNWAPIVGATLIQKQIWDKIPAPVQQAMAKAAAEAGFKIRSRSRQENDEAVAAMQKRGLKITPASTELRAEWQRFSETIYPSIRGSMVPADMFDEVQRLLKEFRAAGGRGSK
jgi:TRAP-type transport system periplasmic protein